MRTKAQARTWINNNTGKGIDFDGYFGWQCVDLAVAYMYYLTDKKLRIRGNAKDLIYNDFGNYATVIRNTPSFEPKLGDLAIWRTGSFSTWGHVAIVINGNPNGDLQFIRTLDQNWNGGGMSKTEVATIHTHNYTGITHFIRPNFASEEKKIQTYKAESQPKKAKKDGIKKVNIKYDKTRINWTMDKRGHKPKGIVIHNDAGGQTGFQYKKSLQNAGYNRWAQGIAHSYISEGQIWQAIDESRIGWHTANQYGNREYYGIEACQSLTASDSQFLKNEQTAFYEAARLLKSWGLEPNRNTVRLHMEFSQTACPHRSMKLHTGIDPTKQSVSQVTINKMKDYFIKQIKMYYNGKVPTPTVITSENNKTKPTKASNNKGWSMNEYGTYYKVERGSFKCTVRQGIVSRYVGPFTSCPQSGVLYYGQSLNYDTVCKQDGYVWISYTKSNGKNAWLPVRTWNEKNDTLGALWGDLY